MKITTVGIDLAKNVFQVHGVDEGGKVVLKKSLKRTQVVPFFANLEPCRIGLEACGGAHHWARALERLGHTVKLMAPQFVKPYVKTNQNDAADAEAICEAVARPSMRFVPIKTHEQQAVLALHRARQGFVKARTGQANQIRGLLAEYGIVIAQGIGHIAQRLPEILEDGENGLPGVFRELLQRLGEHLKALDQQVDELDAQIQRWHRAQAASRKLAAIPGIGPLTASALVATIGDGRQSGTSESPSILNASPEAAVGGNLMILKTGDRVRLDLNRRRLDLLLSQDEIEARRRTTKPTYPASQTPWQEIQRNLVGQFGTGACLEPAVLYLDIARTKGLPRRNH